MSILLACNFLEFPLHDHAIRLSLYLPYRPAPGDGSGALGEPRNSRQEKPKSESFVIHPPGSLLSLERLSLQQLCSGLSVALERVLYHTRNSDMDQMTLVRLWTPNSARDPGTSGLSQPGPGRRRQGSA